MENLLFANTAITVKVLNIFRNAMHHLGKRHASPFALELAEKILPLFNHVSLLWEAELCGWVLDRSVFSFLSFSGLSGMTCPVGSVALLAVSLLVQLGCSW